MAKKKGRGNALFKTGKVYRQCLVAAVKAVAHIRKYLTVAAAQLWVLTVIVFQEMSQWQAAIISIRDGLYVLPDIAHAAKVVHGLRFANQGLGMIRKFKIGMSCRAQTRHR